MPADPSPNAELLSSLGRLVRGLSALFWGLPITLVVCFQTAKGEWLRQFGILPPIISTAILFYALSLLGHFQKQERIWRAALDRAKIFALLNLGCSPFLYWYSKIPSNPFFTSIVIVSSFSGLLFLFTLNPVLNRLSAMLPDETMRAEARLFTSLNRYLLGLTLLVFGSYLSLRQISPLPQPLIQLESLVHDTGPWLAIMLVLLPLAMTMALTWKIKEIILASVFGPE